MKKFYLLALTLLVIGFSASAQKVSGTVKGILRDSASKTLLSDATVSVMRLKDSSLISFTVTGPNGSFEIKNLEAGDYLLNASFTGLQTKKTKFTISTTHTTADLGFVQLDRYYKTMEGVVITDDAPVKVKGDTLSYTADAFKTKPNATVEDLLKKLPGVTVDRDGTVKAQGEQVQKVYVDGKEFFSNDPKLATKNITADMVDQVEVYDDMSEQSKFNRIDDGSRSKAINLKLKKDKKKGVFGKALAGYGTNQRWDLGLNANMFKGATQTSIIAKANNTNNIGFTFSDMIGMFGSGGGGMNMGGGGGGGMNVVRTTGGGSFGGLNLGTSGSGITKSSQFGVNYRDTWSKTFDVNGSYFFNHVNTDNLRRSYRTTFVSDSTLYKDDLTKTKAENDNHRFNMNLIISIDSFNSVIYNPSISYQKSYNTYSLDTFSTDIMQKNGTRYRSNESKNYNNSDGDGYNLNNNLIWRRKFRTPGRTLSVTLNNTLSSNQRNAFAEFDAKYYLVGGAKLKDSTSKTLNKNLGDNNNYSAGLSYTEPLARDKILELNYNHSRNNSSSERNTYNYNGLTGKYDQLISRLSNDFETDNVYDRIGSNFRMVKKKWNAQVGISFQQATLENNNRTKNTEVNHTFHNILPTASFNYQFARSKSFRMNYRGTTRMPNVTQLQDVEDVSNPFYITRGNPGLKQEFNHNVTLSYNFFDIVKFRNLFAFLTYTNTQNKISSQIEQLQGGLIQRSTPVNINGGIYNVTANVNLGIPIKGLKGGNFNTNTSVSYNHDANFVNQDKSFTKILSLGEELRLSYNWKEKLDLGISASTRYSDAKYTLQPNLNNAYFTHVISSDATYTFPKGFIVSTDFDYTFNTGRSDGFNQNYAMWNGSFAKEVFKNKRGEIKLSVFDILNQNISIARNTTLNYVEDVQTSVLNRFYMLTFTYKLNRMGGRMMPAMMERATKGMRIMQ